MENQYLDSNLEPSAVPINYGSFLRRLAATFIDGFVFMGVFFVLLAATGGIGKIIAVVNDLKENGGDPNEAAVALVGTFLFAILGLTIVQWLYFAYFESSEKQGTFGKQAMGLIVTDLNGNRLTFVKASIRHFARILPTLIPLLGNVYTLADYLCQPFTEKKQTLHDMAAGALVLRKA
jgi:uncharacterized RDD family membrane protein YckC